MATKKITSNRELRKLVNSMDVNKCLFAIRTKGLIEVFDNEKEFSRAAVDLPEAVQGELTPYNYIWYRL